MALMSTTTKGVNPPPASKTVPEPVPRDGKYCKLHKFPHCEKMAVHKPYNYFRNPTKGEENKNNPTLYTGK